MRKAHDPLSQAAIRRLGKWLGLGLLHVGSWAIENPKLRKQQDFQPRLELPQLRLLS
jgi:hypothetical protein